MADAAVLPRPQQVDDTNEDPGADARGQDPRVGLSKQPEEQIVRQVMEWWKDSADRTADRRKRRAKCHRMYDGDQWEKTDVAQMKRQKRPALTLNLLLSIIAAVEGQEQNNRQEMKYYGVGEEDDKGAEAWTKLLKWIINGNEGDFELSRQFKEMLISGEGWIVPFVDYLDDPEGQIGIEFVDNDEMFDDPYSTHPVGTDARRRQRVKMLTIDEGEALWPGKFQANIEASVITNSIEETDSRGYPDIYLTPQKPGSVKLYDAKDKTWAVIQTWWWEIEDGWHVKNEQTGQIDEHTDEQFQQLVKQRKLDQLNVLNQVLSGQATLVRPGQPAPVAPDPNVDPMGAAAFMQRPPVAMPPSLQATKRPIKTVYECFCVYDSVLECGPIREQLKMFPAVPLRGIRRKSVNDWIGLVEPLIDLQKQHNVEQSTLMQLVQLMPKASWMAPKGAYHNKQDWENGIATPGKMLEYNAQRGKPEPIENPSIPRHLMELAQTRPQSMREVSGVNVELTGQRQGSDPGVVMEQRAKAAQTVLAPLFENARRAKKVLGKVLMAYMQAHLSPGRIVRVLGPDGPDPVTISQPMLDARYDLAVDETDQTVNDRIATLNLMQTTLPTLVSEGVPIPPSIVDLVPMETKLRDEWKRMIYWQLQIAGKIPPKGWNPGDPIPIPGAPPPGGMPAPAAPPGAQPSAAPPPA